jgi:hypothetical protein
MKIMFLCFMFSGLFVAFGQTSCFTVKVVDHETGEPLPGMKVGGSVGTNIAPGWGWGSGKGIDVDGKETDADGCYTFTIDGGNGRYGVSMDDQKGYYEMLSGGWSFQKATGIFPFRRYQPWNPTIEIRAVKKRNPIPMHVIQYDGKIPVKETPVGFDLLNGDWVQPHGKGENSDIMFTLIIKEPPKGVAKHFPDYDLVVSFPHAHDGIQECVNEDKPGLGKREFRILNMLSAPKKGYQNQYIQQHSIMDAKPNKHICDYFFRIRSETQADGSIKEGLYGKIYNGIECSRSGSSFVFLYYVNLRPGDTNLEFDGKTAPLENGSVPVNQP